MTKDRATQAGPDRRDLEKVVDAKERRKLRARRAGPASVWFGLGMFGLVGWSVAIPTLIGVALGVYIDTAYPSRFSWTLMLLLCGVLLGCLNAWLWVTRERRSIERVEEGAEDDD